MMSRYLLAAFVGALLTELLGWRALVFIGAAFVGALLTEVYMARARMSAPGIRWQVPTDASRARLKKREQR